MKFFSGLFSKGISGDYFLALDLGNKSIKALLFRIVNGGKNIEVEGFGEADRIQSDGGFQVWESIMPEVVSVAAKAIKEAMKKAKGVAPKIILGATGDLLQGDSVTKRCIREDSKEKITTPELKNIIQKVQWGAWNNIRKLVRDETGYSELDVKIINSRIQEIKVDGYRVTNPVGFTGREVSISIFNAYSALGHIEFLNAVGAKLNKELFFIAAGSYAVSQAITRSLDEKINTLLLDIGSFTTDVTFIQDSKLKFIKTLAIGSKIFNQRISREFGVNNKEAELIKIKYNNNLLSSTASRKIRNIIQMDISIWLSALELSLGSVSKKEILPGTIFIHGAGSQLSDIKKNLEANNWRKNLSLPKKLEVKNLLPELFSKLMVNLPPELNTVKHTTILALAVLSLELAQSDNQINKNLRRISRIISK